MELKDESCFIRFSVAENGLASSIVREDPLKRELEKPVDAARKEPGRPRRSLAGPEIVSGNSAAKRPVRLRAARGLTREERRHLTRKKLFDAAAEIVGRFGYAEASIQEITQRAGVAMGTFYNYFDSRQDLLNQLLPTIGEEMYAHIRTTLAGITDEVAREEGRFRAFFEFIALRPAFYRILHEAEQFAPEGFRQHMTNISAGYVRALKRSRESGIIEGYEPADLEVIAYILMAARDYVSMRFCVTRAGIKRLPDEVVGTYMRLLTEGLFNGRKSRRRSSTIKGSTQ